MHLRKKLRSLVQVGLAGIGLVGVLKYGGTLLDRITTPERDSISMRMPTPDVKAQIAEDTSQEDREAIEELLDLMDKTPHGRQLLRTLGEAQTKLGVVDSFKGGADGQATGTEWIKITREKLHTKKGLWILAHEATHIQNHMNFDALPQTLDDAHTVDMLNEGLAERGAFLVFSEVANITPDWITQEEYDAVVANYGYGFLQGKRGALTRQAQGVFEDRVKNGHRSSGWDYEKQSEKLCNEARTKILLGVDAPILKNNPNWNKVVQKMSGGEVHSVSNLPLPTWDLVKSMIYDGRIFGCEDLSCIELHREDLLKGNGLKSEVFKEISFLMYNSNLEDEAVIDCLKDLMPKSYMKKFREKIYVGWLEDSEEGRDFLAKQTNQGYLNKALKALNNSAVDKLAK